jgi:hypothetical protein
LEEQYAAQSSAFARFVYVA